MEEIFKITKTEMRKTPKGRVFVAKFLTSGLCGYGNKKVYLSPCATAILAESLKGCPVTVGHVGALEYDEMRKIAVGYVSEVYKAEESDDWFARFVVFDEKALVEIDVKGARFVSCAYQPEYLESDGGRLNGINYDKEVIGGRMWHLALVKKPRYNGADVIENSLEDNLLLNGDAESFKEKGNVMFAFKKIKEEVEIDAAALFNTDAGEVTIEEAIRLVNEGVADKAKLETKDAEIAAKDAEIEAKTAEVEAKTAEAEKAVSELAEVQKELSDAKAALDPKDGPEGTDADLKEALNNSLSNAEDDIVSVINISTVDGTRK